MVTRISKNLVKHFSHLKSKKGRDELNLYLAEGDKIAKEVLQSKAIINSVIASADWISNNLHLFKNNTIYEASVNEIEKISSLKTPNQVIVAVEKETREISVTQLQNKLSLALDNIQDPGNLGTIIRLADWFGIENIICSINTVELYNPKVIQATMGAFLRVNVAYVKLNSFLKEAGELKSFPIFGTVMDGNNIYQTKLSKNGLIVMGNESNGISEEIRAFISEAITIPNFSLQPSKTESLNVSVATAIICSEFRSKNTLGVA